MKLFITSLFSVTLFTAGLSQIKKEYYFTDSISANIRKYRLERENEIPIYFTTKKPGWKNLEIPLSKTEKDKYLKKLAGNKFFEPSTYLVREEYHIIDFNGDTKPDIIFTGREPGGGEIDNMAFFENEGDSLRLTLKLLGTIIDFKKESKKSPATFTVWEWPCCDYAYHNIYYYSYFSKEFIKDNLNSDQGHYNQSYGKFVKNNHNNFKVVEEYLYVKSTYLPKNGVLKSSIHFKTNADSTSLHTNPSLAITSQYDFYIPEDYKYDIVLSILPVNSTGTIICTEIINEIVYAFVKLDSAYILNKPVFRGRSVTNFLGWMELSDLDVVEQK